MLYKIAIASSDEVYIDETFGQARYFHIFEVEDGRYQKVEKRIVETSEPRSQHTLLGTCDYEGGYSANGGGCVGSEMNLLKVELIADCRCVICKKIGFQILKQLENRAITAFDVSCRVGQALEKITSYYAKVDRKQSLKEKINVIKNTNIMQEEN